jgi:hypothetical protein
MYANLFIVRFDLKNNILAKLHIQLLKNLRIVFLSQNFVPKLENIFYSVNYGRSDFFDLLTLKPINNIHCYKL